MKRKPIELIKQFLLIQMNHWVLTPLFVAVLGLSGQPKPFLLYWFLMSAVPVYLYYVRSKVDNFFVFFLLHLAVPCVWIVLPIENIWLKVSMGVMALFYIVRSIAVKMAGKGASEGAFPPFYSMIIIGMAAFAHNFWSERNWDIYYLTAAFIYLGCYFIYYFMEQYMYFMSVNQFSASNIPEFEIFSSGMKQTLMFSAGGMGLLFLTANVEWVSYIAVNLFRELIAFTGIMYDIFGPKGQQSQSFQEETLETGTQEVLVDAEGTNPIWDLFWKILEYVVMVVLIAAIVAVVAYGLVKGYKFLRNHFASNKKEEEHVLQTGRDIRETIAVDKEERTGFKLFTFRNYTEKVRKLYKKHVLKNKSAIIGDLDAENLNNLTAKECCDKLSAVELQGVYEKARYSDELVTAEDLKLLKHAGR